MLRPDVSGPRRAGTATGIPDYQLRRKVAMLKKGLEPSRDSSHWYLKPGRLPIPPLEQVSNFRGAVAFSTTPLL